jgi:hypothetical protein
MNPKPWNRFRGQVRSSARLCAKRVKGKNPHLPNPVLSVTAIIMQHGKRNMALRAAGVMPIVCRIADGSGVTGVSIFDASPEDVERIYSSDPGVRAGVFTLRFIQPAAFLEAHCRCPTLESKIAHHRVREPTCLLLIHTEITHLHEPFVQVFHDIPSAAIAKPIDATRSRASDAWRRNAPYIHSCFED